MIDIRKLKELVRLMVENDLVEMDLRDTDETVSLKRPVSGVPAVLHTPSGGVPQAVALPVTAVAAAPAPVVSAPAAPIAASLPAIESPMVGTYYSSPGPGKTDFVAVGTRVGPDTTVCLIEAMKIFNEIKAEQSGTIAQILVESAKPVEFGQKLFVIRPD
ncbi:MAG: acetyl-CoA carboxylase biotin carboxyl carrier protein [Planctomycetota bacterium]|nr:acetyl-CoA carboxylase biotin carboxyl carrier protein [Planctomycetota bacterium]